MSHVQAAVDPILGFSTLGCPEWSPTEVIEHATAMGYQAIEWRGGPSGHVPATTPRKATSRLRDQMESNGIRALALTTYGSLVAVDPATRSWEAEGLRRDLDVAADLGAAFVRVFVGIPETRTAEAELIRHAIDALDAAIVHALDVGVGIALEPHDIHARSTALRPILEGVAGAQVGVIWDVGTAAEGGEKPEETLEILGPWLRYVQLNDGRRVGDEWQPCLLGRGEVAVGRALTTLSARGPLPPLCVEYPRAWDSRLEPAAVALPAAITHVRSILASLANAPGTVPRTG